MDNVDFELKLHLVISIFLFVLFISWAFSRASLNEVADFLLVGKRGSFGWRHRPPIPQCLLLSNLRRTRGIVQSLCEARIKRVTPLATGSYLALVFARLVTINCVISWGQLFKCQNWPESKSG